MISKHSTIPVPDSLYCRRFKNLVLPSSFDINLSSLNDDVKLAELSENGFEWKNVTFLAFLGGGGQNNLKQFDGLTSLTLTLPPNIFRQIYATARLDWTVTRPGTEFRIQIPVWVNLPSYRKYVIGLATWEGLQGSPVSSGNISYT